jgi:putative membrane protein
MMGGYGRGYGGYNDMMGGGLGGILFFAFGLLILVGIVLLIVWAVRTMSGGHSQSGPGAPPMQMPPQQDEACSIARKRFASGEITKEQYEEICKSLGV